MKKVTLLLLSCSSLLLFTQCRKSAGTSIQSLSAKTKAVSVAAAATASCACAESATKVTGAQAEAWAKQFAPLAKFDRSAPDYPTTVEDIWANTDPASIVCGGKLVLLNDDPPRSLNFPTYYDVLAHPNDANKVFIDYWMLYKRQSNCIGSTGGHDYDLEHMVVQFNKVTQRVLTVTYFQHKGWYTKDWRNVDPATRIEVYVGKKHMACITLAVPPVSRVLNVPIGAITGIRPVHRTMPLPGTTWCRCRAAYRSLITTATGAILVKAPCTEIVTTGTYLPVKAQMAQQAQMVAASVISIRVC